LRITGQYPRQDGTVPIFTALESVAFRERFGPIAGRFPAASLPLYDAKPLGPLLVEARNAIDTATTPVIMPTAIASNNASRPRASSTSAATSSRSRPPRGEIRPEDQDRELNQRSRGTPATAHQRHPDRPLLA